MRDIFVIMWKTTSDPDRTQMTIWRMRIACCITKATDTHTKYVILIAFAMQIWLRERTPKLRYTYLASPKIHQ
jgi:hypothetical protein